MLVSSLGPHREAIGWESISPSLVATLNTKPAECAPPANEASRRENTAASGLVSSRPLQSLYNLTAPLLRAAISNEEADLSFRGERQPLFALFGCGIGGIVMVDSDLSFLLIPLAPALAFMLWVIWALERQIRRDRRHLNPIARPKARSESLR